jgi:major membrane immunogen (membrane-anchored lipoprotein)
MYLRLLFIIAILIGCNCQEKNNSLDAIKKYQPDEKNFKASLVSLHFIIETSPISRVDSVFKQMIANYDLPIDASDCQDGTYSGESPYDAYDYKHVVTIEIEYGKITDVQYDEVHRDGTSKQSDSEYNIAMKVAGTSPAEAYPKMEKQLLKKQDLLNVDAVTGATYSLYRFRYAVTIALLKAKLGIQS